MRLCITSGKAPTDFHPDESYPTIHLLILDMHATNSLNKRAINYNANMKVEQASSFVGKMRLPVERPALLHIARLSFIHKSGVFRGLSKLLTSFCGRFP